jgi:hypothetical protein
MKMLEWMLPLEPYTLLITNPDWIFTANIPKICELLFEDSLLFCLLAKVWKSTNLFYMSYLGHERKKTAMLIKGFGEE